MQLLLKDDFLPLNFNNIIFFFLFSTEFDFCVVGTCEQMVNIHFIVQVPA